MFYGESLSFDPTRHVELSTITVLVDPHDPSSYHMDVSFLPKVRSPRGPGPGGSVARS
jgi:hypothetical protein